MAEGSLYGNRFSVPPHWCPFQDNSSKKWTGEWTGRSDSLTAVAEILNKYFGTDCEDGEGMTWYGPCLEMAHANDTARL